MFRFRAVRAETFFSSHQWNPSFRFARLCVFHSRSFLFFSLLAGRGDLEKIGMLPLLRGHANLLCIVPILTDDPRRESVSFLRSVFSFSGAS